MLYDFFEAAWPWVKIALFLAIFAVVNSRKQDKTVHCNRLNYMLALSLLLLSFQAQNDFLLIQNVVLTMIVLVFTVRKAAKDANNDSAN